MSKILEICFKESLYDSFDENTSTLFKVSDNFNVCENDLVLVEPKYKKDICMSLGLVLSVSTIDDIEDSIQYTNLSSKSIQPIIPFFISVLDLTQYKEQRAKLQKKNLLEKKLDEATKNLEKVAKYKALADLNPEYKALYDEYIGMITDDKKLLK